MRDVIVWLDHWQTLVGSILGGVFALGTVLVVAASARRSVRRTAGSLLMTDLLSISNTAEFLNEDAAKKKQVPEGQYALWVAGQLNWRRPRLSSSYDTHMANLVGVHDGLSSHLSLMKMVYSSLDDHLGRIQGDAEQLRGLGNGVVPRAIEETQADAKVVADGLKRAGAHAGYAAYYLEKLVLGKVPGVLVRVRMWLRPTPLEVKSMKLLYRGEL